MGDKPNVFSRVRNSKTGAAAAEFAIMLPVLLLIMAGALQYGVMMMTYNSMVNGARSAARALSLGDATDAQVRTAVKNWLPGWVSDGAVTVTTTSIGTDRIRVDVSVPASETTVLRIGPMPETLAASVLMMREK